jgi:hydrogenase maturation factor
MVVRLVPFGKPSRKYFQRVIYGRLGARRGEVIVGPRFGVDNAIVRVGQGKVLVVTADPLSYIPSLGGRDSAWLSANLIASDLATSGFSPQYGVFDFNLPPRMKGDVFADYWKHFHGECKKLGLAIIGGHTGRYPGCDYTVIGAGVMYAFGEEERYLTSSMGCAGDDIVLTKGVAIETTAVLARAFPKTVRKAVGANLFAKACGYLRRVSTVQDSLTAASVGVHESGVTAMHDATEGGVIAAVFELAHASSLGAELDLSAIPVSPETNEICKLFRINPLNSLSEGSLIIASRPARTGKLMARLRAAWIESAVIGRLSARRVFWGADSKGARRTLRYPKYDPYWKAYWRATTKHWK